MDDFVIRSMHRLGYDAPVTPNPRAPKWDQPVSVTPALYQRLLSMHDEVNWDEIATRHLPVIAAESKKHLWLPFDLHTMNIDWDNPILGFSIRSMMSRELLNRTSAREVLGRWPANQMLFRVDELLDACVQFNSHGQDTSGQVTLAQMATAHSAWATKEAELQQQLASLQTELRLSLIHI